MKPEKIPIEKMDAVDQRQQYEIEKSKIWIRVMAVLCTLLTIGWVAVFAVLLEFLEYVKTHP